MSSTSIRWQDFDAGPADGPEPQTGQPQANPGENIAALLARAKGVARAEGFAEGVAETETRIDRALHDHVQTLAASIEAASAQTEHRRKDSIAFIGALVSSLMRRIAPHIAELELPHEVVRILTNILEDAPPEELVIDVAEAQHQPLEALLAANGMTCTLRPVSDLTNTGARVHWRGGFDHLDMTATIESVRKLVLDRLGEADRFPP